MRVDRGEYASPKRIRITRHAHVEYILVGPYPIMKVWN